MEGLEFAITKTTDMEFWKSGICVWQLYVQTHVSVRKTTY